MFEKKIKRKGKEEKDCKKLDTSFESFLYSGNYHNIPFLKLCFYTKTLGFSVFNHLAICYIIS